MKINIRANELVDGKIDFLSLVKNGANRSPWKIVKAEDAAPTIEDAITSIANAVAKITKTSKEINQSLRKDNMRIKDIDPSMFGKTEPVRKADPNIQAREIASLRYKLSGLNEQQQNLWERPNTPAFQKFDDELTFRIEKCESELRVLTSDEEQMNRCSAFFRRGGTSTYAMATVSDSAYDQRSAAVRKAENEIDLSPIVTQSDFNRINKRDVDEVRKIDLGTKI